MKVVIRVEDTVRYDSDIVIEVPDYMSEEELDAHLDDVEKKLTYTGNFEDVAAELDSMGFAVTETITGFPRSPDNTECEITDYVFVEDDV